jgi:hypothetical protein
MLMTRVSPSLTVREQHQPCIKSCVITAVSIMWDCRHNQIGHEEGREWTPVPKITIMLANMSSLGLLITENI